MLEVIRIGPLELRFLRSKHETSGSLDMFEMTVPHEGRMPVAHYHRDWDETIYGLIGTVTFTVGGKDHAVGPGDVLFIPRGVVHGFDNRSGATATCLGVLTPGVLGPEYFRELASLVAAGPPDEAVVREIMLRHGLVPAADR
ncbi:Cupin 2 conserved barrel domain protein [Methylobacterium sp. 4-46]|uniref:cupin domain-containing protein n=1 Tax=unclassified Methylobacterium TaxID=2615210 RepID=UPI000152D2B6|nr:MULTISPECIES: cupin domain-containing protein [Methylobacterium]ACA19857.1 Cupin 2 conserved barrel domain protein [Methylobacterium sp. 4-46]WFT79041.1 cupin domain-containing protein [Methylobacterium nodulans]